MLFRSESDGSMTTVLGMVVPQKLRTSIDGKRFANSSLRVIDGEGVKGEYEANVPIPIFGALFIFWESY